MTEDELAAIEARQKAHAGYGPDESYQLLYRDIPALIAELRRARAVLGR